MSHDSPDQDGTYEGGCLCGAVRFTATLAEPEAGTCHCGMCRRWGTGPLMTVHATDVAFEGAEHITRFRSSDWAERGFCNRCGSNLFYHMIGTDAYDLSAGALDDSSGLALSIEVYIDAKPDFYAFANDTRKMTEADIMAMVAASGAQPPDTAY